MPNPFTSVEKTENNVMRNVWDWSHSNNFTTELGKITPVLCERVPAGTSLSINSRYAMQFMPMMFPIQNHIKARISFFKVPVRALWKNYRDWISTVNQTDSTGADVNSKFVPPFIGISTSASDSLKTSFLKYFGTRSLADYFGLPTEISSNLTPFLFSPDCVRLVSSSAQSFSPSSSPCVSSPVSVAPGSFLCSILSTTVVKVTSGSILKLRINNKSIEPAAGSSGAIPLLFSVYNLSVSSGALGNLQSSVTVNISYNSDYTDISIPFSSAFDYGLALYISSPDEFTYFPGDLFLTQPSLVYPSYDYTPSKCPWYNITTKTGLKVSSLPWRAYEAIYNAFYRNNRNNPLIVNGVKRYNTWTVLYDEDGCDTDNIRKYSIDSELNSDDYFYGFKYINWEPDEYTTAVQSPQEGIAPLVGLTVYSTTPPSSPAPTLATQITDEDGQMYNVKLTGDEEGLTDVEYSKTDVAVDGTPVTSVYAGVTQGISINDFRLVNAYQRYLELNMRRGYSYKDIIEGRYDVNVRFSDLLLPEFLGGFTREVGINPITQTTPTDESGTYQGSLGSQAGQAFISGSSDNNITCFCDEDSYVLGLITVSPDSIYTQTLAPHFLIRNPLDIFSPEYANIGFQPITMAEIAPLQVKQFGGSDITMETVFGYQRPWSDLIHKHNSAHGLFRTQLRNFLMNRVFAGIPRLSKQFMIVSPDQVNDVFSVTETTDKIFGQVYFDIKCKNGVPRNNLPRLE